MEKIIERKKLNIPDNLNEKCLKDLILRVTKREDYKDKFDFKKISDSDTDCYSIYDEGEKIVIEASNTVAAAVAFNYYLTEKCASYFGPLTKNINLPENPPEVGEKHTEKSVFVYRYFMNYCTYGYTYLFAGWEEFERLIDWLALSGVNLMFNIVGHEAVERDMLIDLGYTKEEATAYIAGPAYMPWQWLGNMTSFAGNLPDWWFEKQKKLGQKMNERLRQFGIGIMAPGFFGLVPLDFKEKFPESSPLEQGSWCDAFERQPLLTDTDKMFDKVADAFYKKTKEYFGEINYFAGDPFHEGGLTDGVDLTAYAKKVLGKMKQHAENGVWFFQSWGLNPRKEILDGFEKDDVLIGYLKADKAPKDFKDYGGYPWLYLSVPNYGGTRKLDGYIKGFLSDPFEIAKRPERRFAGIGMAPEAVELDEIVFDLISRTSIRKEKIEPLEYIKSSLNSRYSLASDNLVNAYKILLDEVYAVGKDNTYKGRESALCSRPALNVHTVSYWAAVTDWYNSDTVLKVLNLMLSEYESLKDNECYRLDITELARQLNAELAHEYIDLFSDAFKNKDRETFEKYTEKFLGHFDNTDALMGLNDKTRLDSWVMRAENYSEDEEQKANFRFNARNLILLWASKEGSFWLRDYAYREWNGMMPHYKKRWERFIKELSAQFGGELSDTVDWTEMDYEFTKNNVFYETAKKDKDLLSIIKSIIKEKENSR